MGLPAVMGRLVREGTREGMSSHPATRRVRLVLTAVQPCSHAPDCAARL